MGGASNHENAHGDVVQLTDNSGTVLWTYEYDAFGVEKNPDPNDENPWRFCGEYFDRETGTVYLRARHYDARIGRFTQQDGWGYANIYDPLGLNLYTYCNGNPVMWIDPSGHSKAGDFFRGLGKAYFDGFRDFFVGQWEFVKGVVTDPVGTYISYASDPWNWLPPGVKMMRDYVTTVGGIWSGIFKGDFEPAAYAMGGNTAAGLEMLVTYGVVKGVSGIKNVRPLRFGSNDLVYGPSAGGKLLALQRSAGGKLLTDLPKPANSSWIDFSTNKINATVESGNYIRFDLTHMKDISGVLNNTGQYAGKVTAQELRYIQNNWGRLRGGVKFYKNGVEVKAPWEK